MKVQLERAIFVNRAPFERLDLSFEENGIAVLTSVNGKGKTTILSHIADSFYEIARQYFPMEFEDHPNKLYRLSSATFCLDVAQPSFFYLRYRTEAGRIDYLDIRNVCTEDQYIEAIPMEDRMPFGEFSADLTRGKYIKQFKTAISEETAKEIFNRNIHTYFPAYRYERPGYLNEPYQIALDFATETTMTGHLKNPIEVRVCLPKIVNWLMDVVLDLHQYPGTRSPKLLADQIITSALVSKGHGEVGYAIGPRGYGFTRLQIISGTNGNSLYNTIFNLSSGELAIVCIFLELLRQGDRTLTRFELPDITGIVLIDEIEKHLHIKLQKEVLPVLLNLFPNVQFIVSSHSPFLSMGLSETALERSTIVDLDKMGVTKDPTNNDLYNEVYSMMVDENERFKMMYDSITEQFAFIKKLQLVTEGKNTEHIRKALQMLEADILNEIQIIAGCEDKSGDQQLKNAFEIMSKANHENPFLFVWDCDSANHAVAVTETDNFKSFAFERNAANGIVKKGIENAYPEELFDDALYDISEITTDYGETITKKLFNKNRFLERAQETATPVTFQNFVPLLEKIKLIIAEHDERSRNRELPADNA